MTSTFPDTMRAWTWNHRGPPSSVLTLRSDIPTPKPSILAPGEVLVKVSHVALNPGFLIMITHLPHLTSAPWIPEIEFCGTVVAVRGTESSSSTAIHFQVGDQILGSKDLGSVFRQGGVLADYVVCSVDTIVPQPQGMPVVEAAGLTAVGCTAIQAVDLAGLKRGDKVLITGGSGGLGTMLVQVCRSVVGSSGIVVATCSGPNIPMVKDLGADEVIDYTVHDPLHSYLAQHHREVPFNAILDVVGADNELYTQSPSYLTPNGLFLLLGSMPAMHSGSIWRLLSWVLRSQINRYRPVLLGGTPRPCRLYSTKPDKKSLERVIELVQKGEVKGVVDSVWKMDQGLKAYERSLTGRAKGKIVIDVQA